MGGTKRSHLHRNQYILQVPNNTLELKILPTVILCAPRPNDRIEKRGKPHHGRPYPIQRDTKATLTKEINRLVSIGVIKK